MSRAVSNHPQPHGGSGRKVQGGFGSGAGRFRVGLDQGPEGLGVGLDQGQQGSGVDLDGGGKVQGGWNWVVLPNKSNKMREKQESGPYI